MLLSMNSPYLRGLLLLLVVLVVVGCKLPRVHKISIQQGNVVTQTMVNRLEYGMTKSQVRFIMGEPVVRNPFEGDRWDYVYTIEIPRVREIKTTMSLFFTDDKLTHYLGDMDPSPDAEVESEGPEVEGPQEDASTAADALPEAGSETEEAGIFDPLPATDSEEAATSDATPETSTTEEFSPEVAADPVPKPKEADEPEVDTAAGAGTDTAAEVAAKAQTDAETKPKRLLQPMPEFRGAVMTDPEDMPGRPGATEPEPPVDVEDVEPPQETEPTPQQPPPKRE